jgi:hypothetical protein
MLLIPAATLGLLAFLPPVAAEESVVTGFTGIQTHAQGQAATGYFFAVGEEENRLVGALSEINNPPAGSKNIAAFIQRGVAATYTYGLVGGGGPGQNGKLPDPPPGEAGAFYPANPQEAGFQGPVTTGANGPVVDGRFHAKASDTPTGRADAAVTSVEVPGQLAIGQVIVVSHTEPSEGGIAAESISVLHGITVGPLHIETMVSRAYGFVSAAPGAPKGIASTVVEGATVNGTPVQLTDKGLVVGDQAAPGAQDQVNTAITQAGFADIRLVPSLAAPGENNESVQAVTGTLRVVHRDQKFGASNPQGFSGGGFSVGGAEVRVLGHRCAPGCPGAADELAPAEPGLVVPVDQPGPAAAPPSILPGVPPASVALTPAPDLTSPSPDGAGFAYPAGSAAPVVASSGSSTTVAVTPPSLSVPASSPRQAALALASELSPKVARGMRDGYLAVAVALIGVLAFGARFVRGR